VSNGFIVQNVIFISGDQMMKKQNDKIQERTGLEHVKYETIKYATFFAPPAIIYIISYYFTYNILLSTAATFGVMFLAVLIIAGWYYRKTRVVD
jgi:VIT1/CCC1 family predicted Fe2+/Mn2+ transporter